MSRYDADRFPLRLPPAQEFPLTVRTDLPLHKDSQRGTGVTAPSLAGSIQGPTKSSPSSRQAFASVHGWTTTHAADPAYQLQFNSDPADEVRTDDGLPGDGTDDPHGTVSYTHLTLPTTPYV